MPIAFMLDENLSPEIAVVARSLGVDVVHVQAALGKGASDLDVLRHAAALGRCLVTADRRDFRQLSIGFERDGERHAGVLVVRTPQPRGQSRAMATALYRVALRFPDGLPPNTVDQLDLTADP